MHKFDQNIHCPTAMESFALRYMTCKCGMSAGYRKKPEEFLFICFCFDGGTGVWTQGLVLPRQELYNLSHASSTF
jgi:hypothetical protein